MNPQLDCVAIPATDCEQELCVAQISDN